MARLVQVSHLPFLHMAIDKKNPLLIIEDSDEDFEILQILMEDMNVTHPIYRCKTGDTALDFMSKCKAASATESTLLPSIILLDLNLPGVDGREVLERVKQDEQLRTIPVVVFTTSSDQTDIKYCYQQGANGYLIKPVSIELLERKVQAFVDYWLGENASIDWNGINILVP